MRLKLGKMLMIDGAAAGFIMAVYLLTLAPTVTGLDSAELTIAAYILGIAHAPGYAVYLLLGHLFTYLPIGDVGYRLNLLSAVAGVGSSLLVMRLVRCLTTHRLPALTAGLSYAFCFYAWSLSVIAEVYTLQTCWLGLVLWSLCQWQQQKRGAWLQGGVLAASLALANNPATLLWWPGFGLLFWAGVSRKKMRLSAWGWLAIISLCAMTPLLYLPLRSAAHVPFVQVGHFDGRGEFHPLDLTQTANLFWYLSGRQFGSLLMGYATLSEYAKEGTRFLQWLLAAFGGVGVPLGLWGGWQLWQRERLWLAGLGLIMFCHAFFFIGYAAIDKETMFLPVFLIWAVLIGVGLDRFLAGLPSKLYFSALLLPLGLLLFNYPYANVSDFYAPSTKAQVRLEQAAPDALFLATWGEAELMRYHQIVYHIRQDVTVVNIFFATPQHLNTLAANWLDRGYIVYSNRKIAALVGNFSFRAVQEGFQMIRKEQRGFR